MRPPYPIDALPVSVFASAKRPYGVEQTTLDAVVARIRSDELHKQTEHIRQTFLAAGGLAGGQVARDAIKDLKVALPAFTICGAFSHRAIAAWQAHNGLVQVDVDGLTPEQMAALKAQFAAHLSIIFCFASPSGVGLKVGVLVPIIEPATDAAYKLVLCKVNTWLKATFGVENDPATKDCARLAFICHDPAVHYNPTAVPLDLHADVHDLNDQDVQESEEQPAVDVKQRNEPAKDLSADSKRIVWDYISKIASVDGSNGSAGLVRVCRALHTGFALDEATAWKALHRWNTEVADPPWPVPDLGRAMAKVRTSAAKIPMGYLWKDPSIEIPGEPGEADEWPPLVSLDSTDPPEIPASAYPGWLGDMVTAVAESCEVPPELPGLVGLALVSGAAAHRYVVEVKPGYCEPINIWSCVAYPSGGRKTAVFKDMLAPIVKEERRLIADAIREHALWEERQDTKPPKATSKTSKKGNT